MKPVTIEVPNDGQHNGDDDDDDNYKYDSVDNYGDGVDNDDDRDNDCDDKDDDDNRDDDFDDDDDDASVPSVRRTILECSELLQLSIRSLTV